MVQTAENCKIPYGPIDNAFGCRDEYYDDDRLIPPHSDDAEYVNWKDWGLVNPTRNQNTCGSCWAFAAVAAIETQQAIKTGKLY